MLDKVTFVDKLKLARKTQIEELLITERGLQKSNKERFDQLFQAKADKLINEVLNKKHTQLSYLPKSEQELNKLYGTNGIYKYLIHFLEKL